MKNAVVNLRVQINSGELPLTLILHDGQGTPFELRDTEDRVVIIELVSVLSVEELIAQTGALRCPRCAAVYLVDQAHACGEGS